MPTATSPPNADPPASESPDEGLASAKFKFGLSDLPVEDLTPDAAESGPWYVRPVTQALLAALLALLFYARTAGYAYTSWDDDVAIQNNVLVQSISWHSIRQFFTPGTMWFEQLYQPLAYVSFMLESLVGGGPVATHLGNVALHGANAALLWLLTWRLAGRRWAAWVTTLAFIAHPLQVEAVAWCAARKDVLSTLFALLALLAWVSWVDMRRRSTYCWAIMWIVCAVLSKPSMLILPGVLLVLDWYRQGMPPRAEWRQAFWQRLVLPYLLPGIIVVSAYVLNRMVAQPPTDRPDLFMRLACMVSMLGGWVLRLIYLGIPTPFYRWPNETELPYQAAAGASMLLGLLVLLFWAWRTGRRHWLFGLAFTAVAFFPAMMLVLDYRKFLTADHYGYFPLIGLFYIVGRFGEAETPDLRRWIRGIVAIWLVIGVAFANWLLPLWRDSYSLWTHVHQQDPGGVYGPYNLGCLLEIDGRYNEAEHFYRLALDADPDNREASLNLGNVLKEQERFPEAVQYYQGALKQFANATDPAAIKATSDTQVRAMVNLGVCYLLLKRYDDARQWFSIASRSNSPYQSMIEMNLARTDLLDGKPASGITHLRNALALDPGLKDAWETLARVLASQGEFEASRQALRDALAAGVDLDADVRQHLATPLTPIVPASTTPPTPGDATPTPPPAAD